MTRLQRLVIMILAVVAVPSLAAVGWWYYWPSYLQHQAEKAMEAGNWTDAEDLLKRVSRLEPERMQAHYLRAQALRKLGRPVEAQLTLREAVRLGLPQALGHREFALAEADKQFTPNAEANLLEVLKDFPDDEEVLLALARGYGAAQRWREGEQYYTLALEKHPARLEIWMERGRLRLAAVGVYQRRAEEAADDFREVLRQQPNHFEAHLALAHCFLSDAQMPAAKKELLVCRELEPRRVEPLVGLASCAIEDRNYEEAEGLLRQAHDLQPASTYVLTMQGDLELRRERYQQAIPFFKAVLDRDPRDRGAHLKLAQAYRYSGQVERAKEEERIFQELGGGQANLPPATPR